MTSGSQPVQMNVLSEGSVSNTQADVSHANLRTFKDYARYALTLKPKSGHPPLAIVVFVLTLILVGLYLHKSEIPHLKPEEYGPLLAVASGVILVGMSLLYLLAYSFYKDSFYLFISIGWFANLAYVFFDTFFPKSWKDFDYSLQVTALSVFTSIPIYLAGFIERDKLPNLRRLLYETIGWILWFGISMTVCFRLAYGKQISDDNKFMIIIAPILPYSITLLWRLGRRLHSRLNPQVHGVWWTFLFPATFYAYAALQPIYLFKLKPFFLPYIILTFWVALSIKVLNSISALAVIRRDLTREREKFASAKMEVELAETKLRERSALAAIGVLTSSIEHDIRNPLAVIGSEVNRLVKKLQAEPGIVTQLAYIDEQKQRVYDATTLIPLLRGKSEYFRQLMHNVRLDDLVNSAVKDVKKEFENRHYDMSNIFFRVNKEFKTQKAFYVRGYGPLLKQAVINVFKNSIEAIGEARRDTGVIDITIVQDAAREDMIRMDIADNGCGIPAEILPVVTDIFSTRDERKPNSGLGLFITNRILEVHDGNLKIASQRGIKTVVSFLLPKWSDKVHLT